MYPEETTNASSALKKLASNFSRFSADIFNEAFMKEVLSMPKIDAPLFPDGSDHRPHNYLRDQSPAQMREYVRLTYEAISKANMYVPCARSKSNEAIACVFCVSP